MTIRLKLRTLKEPVLKYKKSKEALTVELKREPTINELASEMNITKRRIDYGYGIFTNFVIVKRYSISG